MKFSNIIDILDASAREFSYRGVTFLEFAPRGGMTTRLIREVRNARMWKRSRVAFISGEMVYQEIERRFCEAKFFARGDGIEIYGVDRKFDPKFKGPYDLIVIDRPDLIFRKGLWTNTQKKLMGCVKHELAEHLDRGTKVICGVLKPRP